MTVYLIFSFFNKLFRLDKIPWFIGMPYKDHPKILSTWKVYVKNLSFLSYPYNEKKTVKNGLSYYKTYLKENG